MPLPQGHAKDALLNSYQTLLLKELRQRAKQLDHPRIASVYFGGGTPSLLPGPMLKSILAEIGREFTLAKSIEISAEANPDSALADGWLFEARAAGIERLSLGVQSLDNATLAVLGRIHDARTAEAAFRSARDAGFCSINLDFMWGLPGKRRGQPQKDWLNQLQRVCHWQPEHLSAYCLTLEDGSPLSKAVAAQTLALPKERTLASMYMAGADFLDNQGLVQYEIANFARTGFQCRHNLGYWAGQDYLGLGPGAVSTLRDKRESNPRDLSAWALVAQTGQGRDCEKLHPNDKHKERLMLSLRTVRGLDFAAWRKETGRSFCDDNARLIALLCDKGLAHLCQERFYLSRKGMLVADAIIGKFFDALDACPGKKERCV